MKRIIAVSTLAVAALVGFSSAANAAETATSTHTGTIAATCAVTGTAGTFSATTNTTFDGVVFPSELTSTGGKFTTLCNTATSGIKVAKTSVTVPPEQDAPDVTFTTTGVATIYTGTILGTSGTAAAAELSGNAVHAYSNATSDLNVAVKVKAPANKILQGTATANNYVVVLTATLTP